MSEDLKLPKIPVDVSMPPTEAPALSAEEIVVDTTPPVDPKPRITVRETIYHQIPSEEPTEFSSGFVRETTSEEEPYQRRKKLSEEWEDLDLGWLATSVSMVCMRNEAGIGLQKLPTDEEKEAIKKQIILIRFKGSESLYDLEIHPKESLRLPAYDPQNIQIKCKSGTVRYSLFITPR